MALLPTRTKFRKVQRGIVRGDASRGEHVSFGEYGLQSLVSGHVTGRQIEACRVALSRAVGTGSGQYWIRVFPHKPMSAHPLETRMGKGKGEPAHWVAVIRPGTVLFEVGGVPAAQARLALNKAASKLPISCRLAGRLAAIGG
jgi:large subunit ribosomal protein L16